MQETTSRCIVLSQGPTFFLENLFLVTGNSRRLPTPENGSGSISSGGRNSRNEDSHDELNSTLKNSLSSNSLAPLRKLTNDVSEIVAASKEEELRAQLESALNKSAIALNVDDSSPGGPNGMGKDYKWYWYF